MQKSSSPRSRAKNHLKIININDEYGTPHDLFKDACARYDVHPTIDVAASDANHVLDKYLTKEDNFYNTDVAESMFGNFPYSKIHGMMIRAHELHVKHNVDVMVLCYAKTDTKWWHELVEDIAEVHFVKGRIRFLNENGKIPTWCNQCKIRYEETRYCENCGAKTLRNSAPYPSCWIIYRSRS